MRDQRSFGIYLVNRINYETGVSRQHRGDVVRINKVIDASYDTIWCEARDSVAHGVHLVASEIGDRRMRLPVQV